MFFPFPYREMCNYGCFLLSTNNKPTNLTQQICWQQKMYQQNNKKFVEKWPQILTNIGLHAHFSQLVHKYNSLLHICIKYFGYKDLEFLASALLMDLTLLTSDKKYFKIRLFNSFFNCSANAKHLAFTETLTVIRVA